MTSAARCRTASWIVCRFVRPEVTVERCAVDEGQSMNHCIVTVTVQQIQKIAVHHSASSRIKHFESSHLHPVPSGSERRRESRTHQHLNAQLDEYRARTSEEVNVKVG